MRETFVLWLTGVAVVLIGVFAWSTYPTPQGPPEIIFSSEPNSGFYEDDGLKFICYGKVVKTEEEMTREDLIIILKAVMAPPQDREAMIETLCPERIPFGETP